MTLVVRFEDRDGVKATFLLYLWSLVGPGEESVPGLPTERRAETLCQPAR